MKGSSATSARAKPAPRPIGQSSARLPHTRTSAEEFALGGPSALPDPDHNAYRKDLADLALAGRVIASHYAEPVERRMIETATLRGGPSIQSEAILELAPGDPFMMLDDSLGWAWGYGGKERRVGYVESRVLGRLSD